MNKQTAQLLEQHFDTAFAAPDGIAKLRELILTLAMQGRLVEQDPNDLPASELLKEIQAEKEQLVKAGKIKKPKPLPPIKPEEMPYELPKGWEWVRIKDICHDWGQKTPDTRFTYIDVGAIDNQLGAISPNAQILKASEAPSRARKIVKPGTVIYSTVRPYLQNIAIIEKKYDPEPIASTAFAIVHPFVSLNARFIYHYLHSPFFIRYVESRQKGVAYPAINDADFFSGLYPLPSTSEQHRIVDRIDQLMTRCDEMETLRKEREEKRLAVHAAAINQLLDAPDGAAWNFIQQHFGELYTVKENVAELRKAILQLAVMGRLVPQNSDDPPASELLKEIKAEKQQLVKAGKIKKPKPLPPIKPEEVPFELPNGWEWVRLGEVVSLLGDGIHGTPTYDESGEFFFINGNNLSDGVIVIKENTKKVSVFEFEKHKKELTDRSVLVSINGTIGNVAFYNNEPVMLGKSACYFNLFAQIDKYYIKRLINSSYFMEYAFQAATGSTIKNVSLKAMRELYVPLPPYLEQHRIVARVDQLTALCDTLEQQINAATFKQSEILNAVMARVGG
jgi:type I restriction enzyme S subunit